MTWFGDSIMHWEILRGLIASYSVIPLGRGVKVDFALRHVTEALRQSFWLSLRIASVWRLNILDARTESLEASRDSLIAALGTSPLIQGDLARSMGRRLNSLEQQITSTAAARIAQEREAWERGGRLRLAERLLEKADRHHRTHSERKLLGELIEQALSRKKSS